MNKFKIRPVKHTDAKYTVEYSPYGVLWLRRWYTINYYDGTLWRPRIFSKDRALQVCRQLKSQFDVFKFQAETYR